LLVLGTLLLALAFQGWAQNSTGENPQVIVSVYDDAGVLPTVLAQAERKAARIFERAGLDVLWANCSSSAKHVGQDAGLANGGCAQFDWPTRLAMRIVPRSGGPVNEVFGVAFLSAEGTGCYSDVYYDRAIGLQADWKVALPDILGSVMAHELGHLLLGSNSHASSGIMRGRWQPEELRRLAKGSLLFMPEQGQRMREKLTAAPPPFAVTARSSY
jgi:hypothetical protein